MAKAYSKSTTFSRNLVWLVILLPIAVIAFWLYVEAEKEIDHANDLRHRSYLLADELHQSSDDLTRMARTYVVTGDPIYKHYYQDIIDIRDGKLQRPEGYTSTYWDLVIADASVHLSNGDHKTALLEMMRQAGFTQAELVKLSEAKKQSDELTSIEIEAMRLMELTGRDAVANHAKARLMLYDERYHQAKAKIMTPISEFHQMLDQRTSGMVAAAESKANRYRMIFVLIGFAVFWRLWRTHGALRDEMGGAVDTVKDHITHIGKGDLSQSIQVNKGDSESVLGWLAQMQGNLKAMQKERELSNAKLQRITNLYAALSQCNQAIVRCKDEGELFPQICRDVITFGGMKMAWIGRIDESSNLVKPVASFGAGIEYLDGIEISIDANGPKGRGPTGTALRENRPYWCQDFQHAPETSAWHERGARFGWGASAALPILCKNKVVGAFTLYASEVDSFDEAAQNLLVEMAMDISYALDRFALETEKKATESNYHHLFHSMVSGFAMHEIICDDQGKPVDYRFLEVNPAFYQLTGLGDVNLIGRTVLEVIPNLEPFWIERYGHVALSGETVKFIYPVAILGRHFEVIAYSPEKGKFATLFTDVTERMYTEQTLAIQARRAEALLTLPLDAEKMGEREFMAHGVELAEQLTESQIAFIHLVHEDQITIELGSWSRATQATYCHAAFDNHYPIDKAGVWADALRQRKPVTINDYATATGKHGLPEGHAHLERLISVPVMEGGLVRMMVGVGNKSENYSDLDIETVQLVANTIWHIVQQRRTESALKHSEDIFKHFMDNSPNYVFFKDENIRALRLSKNFEQMVGKPMSEMIGKNMDELFPSELAKTMVEDDKKILHEGKTITVEEELNGRSYSTIKFPILLEGKPTYLAGYTTDITEKKSKDESLRRLTQAVEQSPITIVITDLDSKILYANSNFTKVTGFTLEEVLGKNPRILQSGRTPKATYDDMWAHLTAGVEWRGELINRTKDGIEYIESALISPVRQPNGEITNYLAIKQNITEKRQDEERIQQLAHFDHLTGLPNRSLLNERFSYALSLAQRSGEPLAVMFLDLDHFKNINDTLGHSTGDRFLMEVAQRLKSTIRDEDTVSRLGGDEFILVFPGTDADAAAIVASKLIQTVSQPYQIEQHELIGTPSIGIAIYPNDGDNFEDLLKNADTAMYRVKQDSRNDFRFFTSEMQSHSERNLQLVNAMRHALARNEFHLQYQPQVTLRDGHIIGAEALLRWQHPELGAISPAEFIPIAEDSGQIIPIGEWVLRTAVKQMKDWIESGLPPMVIAVNLSAIQFRQPDLPALVSRILEEAQLAPEYLELELTEAVAMDDPQTAISVMDDLFERGIRMSIDDFGTGYSSLSYLKRFKVYKLKIDQSFVRDISDDPEDKAIVTAIINLASSLGMHTIAEGVETASQLAFLRLQGCDEVARILFQPTLAFGTIRSVRTSTKIEK